MVATIPLGQGKPNRIVFHPDGKTAWVVYDKSHDLGVIDADARKLVKRVKIGGNPYNLDFTPDGRHLLVLDWSSDTSNDEIIFYDLQAEKIDGRVEVSTWPAHSVFSRDGKRLYVSGETAGDLTVIDVATADDRGAPRPRRRRRHGAGAGRRRQVRSTPPPARTRAILKIDTATNKPVGTIALPGIVHESTLTLDGRFLYTTLRKANKIVVVDTATDKIVATIPQKGYPDLVTMEPTGRYALVTNRWADLVSVIDLTTHTQVRTIPVGQGAARDGAPSPLTVTAARRRPRAPCSPPRPPGPTIRARAPQPRAGPVDRRAGLRRPGAAGRRRRRDRRRHPHPRRDDSSAE